jgi:hypothetical protein
LKLNKTFLLEGLADLIPLVPHSLRAKHIKGLLEVKYYNRKRADPQVLVNDFKAMYKEFIDNGGRVERLHTLEELSVKRALREINKL